MRKFKELTYTIDVFAEHSLLIHTILEAVVFIMNLNDFFFFILRIFHCTIFIANVIFIFRIFVIRIDPRNCLFFVVVRI